MAKPDQFRNAIDQPPKNSLRNFPPDLLIVSGIPLFVSIMMMSALLSRAMEHPIATTISSLILALVGAALLFWAKLPLYRSGIYFSFGPNAISETRRIFYYWGIGLAGVGCLVAAMLIPLCGGR